MADDEVLYHPIKGYKKRSEVEQEFREALPMNQRFVVEIAPGKFRMLRRFIDASGEEVIECHDVAKVQLLDGSFVSSL